MAVEPDEGQIAEIRGIAEGDEDGPLVMLNLNRYRDRDAYERYAVVALGVLDKVGGRILWHGDALSTVVGGDAEAYDEVIAVWYPSAKAFLALAMDPDTLAAREHRLAGLERATLIRCEPTAEPVRPGAAA